MNRAIDSYAALQKPSAFYCITSKFKTTVPKKIAQPPKNIL